MTDWNFDNDRRRHFRVEEQVSVDYQIVTDCQVPIDEMFPPSLEFNLLGDLRNLDDEAETQLRRIAEDDKSVAMCLRLINKKIDRIAQALVQPKEGKTFTDITLSEGGISFISEQPLPEAATLALRLQLYPEGSGLISYARVIYSQQQSDQRFRCGCEFIDIDDRNRHLIARHLMESQARARRSQRQQQQSSK